MARKVRATFLYVVVSIFFFASLYHHYLNRDSFSLSTIASAAFGSDKFPLLSPPPPSPVPLTAAAATVTSPKVNHAIHENLTRVKIPPRSKTPSSSLSTASILLPAWEVLVIVSPDHTPNSFLDDGSKDDYVCLYPNNEVSPAKPAGVLSYPDRATFKCELPSRSRRRLPFLQPILTKNITNRPEERSSAAAPQLLRWTHVVYDSLTTDDDVLVFVKGFNSRQGTSREPSDFRCVFYRGKDVDNGVRTAVTTSAQEVFRCRQPEVTAVPLFEFGGEQGEEERIKVTVETAQDKIVVPTLAYYTPARLKLSDPNNEKKSLMCACTMVYNVAKYLKEWVLYHSKIGIEKFILYDNGSDDKLEKAIAELNSQGFDVKKYFWVWPKTQEAGFSHSAIYAKESCSWMAYIDVDEFIYSPPWFNSTEPSKSMLQSMLLQNSDPIHPLGQISIGCHEFGPSNQTGHPVMGVSQGYNCRKKLENRHKSIVLLEAIDDSLLNVIHHFYLKPDYRGKKLSIHDAMVNHYKFQAWPEFKAKFRRRVSAYVVDWTQQVNLHSNDRTPGLGFSPVEPVDWPQKFCEVHDNGLKELTQKWFALQSNSPEGFTMAWQR